MSDQRVEVWTLGARRPAGLPDHCVHVPCLTRSLGERLRAGAPPADPCRGPQGWGWWRSSGGVERQLGETHPAHYVDIEPASWPSVRGLRDHEREIAARTLGVTGMGYPAREANAIAEFAPMGLVGIPQLYRDGNPEHLGARGVRRRVTRWRDLGFERITGLLGGARSGRRWVLDALEECDAQGVGVALWGWGPIQREAAEIAYMHGLGRGGPYT